MVGPNYEQPEDFGYDFTTWVSPYTKSANALGGFAFVLQDWASADGLKGAIDPDIQAYGRKPELLTNERFDMLLKTVLGICVSNVYITNAFPFVKSGGMSSAIPKRDVRSAVCHFAIKELKIVQPTFIFSLGSVAFSALEHCGVKSIKLPHPAARIGTDANHALAWRNALEKTDIRVLPKAAA